MNAIHNWNTWIGTDEAGKGDYFGPLVVAAVYVDADFLENLLDLGVADGKTLSNRRIRSIAESMRSDYAQHIVIVEKMPMEYNSLYDTLRRRGQNLNHLLASLHAEAIHTLANRVDAKHALVDKFAKDALITEQLTQRGINPASRGIKIKQVTKGERDIAVAAASIIARDTFLTRMDTLSETYEILLPRGAYQVVEAGKEFVRMHGKKALGEVAKLHFNLTDVVCAS